MSREYKRAVRGRGRQFCEIQQVLLIYRNTPGYGWIYHDGNYRTVLKVYITYLSDFTLGSTLGTSDIYPLTVAWGTSIACDPHDKRPVSYPN